MVFHETRTQQWYILNSSFYHWHFWIFSLKKKIVIPPFPPPMSTQKINQPREKYVIPCIKKLLGVPNKLPNLEKIREKRKKKHIHQILYLQCTGTWLVCIKNIILYYIIIFLEEKTNVHHAATNEPLWHLFQETRLKAGITFSFFRWKSLLIDFGLDSIFFL